MCEFEGWTKWLEPAFLLKKPEESRYERPEYMTRTEEDEPKYSPEEEFAIMSKQVNESDGFDIDFSYFRCIFNYHPAELDSDRFVEEPETTEDLLKRLSQKSLENHNQEYKKKYEFVKVVKANYHFSAGLMFLITFQVKDPDDELIKLFQARVRFTFFDHTDFVFCRPKPAQQVSQDSAGVAEKIVKKPRLE